LVRSGRPPAWRKVLTDAHRSLPEGLYTNDIWTGICGTIAAIEQWRLGWAATAI
jgi:hypothetical protein